MAAAASGVAASGATSGVRPFRGLLIDCEDLPKWEGHYELMFSKLERREGETWTVVAAARGGDLACATPWGWDAIVISGSHYDVRDDLPWMRAVGKVIESAVLGPVPAGEAQRRPQVFGSCFGHQLAAKVLGGRVGRNPAGFVFRAEELQPLAALAAHPAAAGVLEAGSGGDEVRLRILESHGDAVLEVPECGTLLATSASCGVEMWGVGDHFLALQSHPEFGVPEMELILPDVRDVLADGGEAAYKASLEAPRDERVLLAILRRFVRREWDA